LGVSIYPSAVSVSRRSGNVQVSNTKLYVSVSEVSDSFHKLMFNCGSSSKFGLVSRGATTAKKLRGTKVWVPTPGHLRPVPGQRPGWVLGVGVDQPLPL